MFQLLLTLANSFEPVSMGLVCLRVPLDRTASCNREWQRDLKRVLCRFPHLHTQVRVKNIDKLLDDTIGIHLR